MKKIYTMFFVLIIFSLGYSQTTIYSQDFETDLDGYSQTPNQTPSADPGDQYFSRAEPSDSNIYESGGPYTNVTGSWMFVGSNPNTINGGSPGILTFDSIDVTGFTNFVFSADFGGVPNDWDTTDELRVEYSWDNVIWNTLYSFSSPATNNPLALENNASGGINTANGTVLTYDLQSISSNNFTGTGTTLYLRIVCDSGANYEAFGVDNIILQGTAASSDTNVQFVSTSASVAENVGTYNLEFSIANEDATATSFDVVLISGDVSDIEFYATETVTFPSGTSANQTVTITITDDALNEADEDLVFQIQNISGGNNTTVGVNDTFTLTIEASDLPPAVEGWQIVTADTEYTIDFDTTVSNVNVDAFSGSGIVPMPASGQLDSNAFRIVGLSTNSGFNFGDSGDAGDFARGDSTGGVSTGGVYAFDVGGSNNALGIQPGGSDFTPGAITVKTQNQIGVEVTDILIEYTIYTFNDQDSSMSLTFAWSDDDITFIDAPTLNFITPETASGSPGWVAETKSILLEGLSISDASNFYLRWLGDDALSSGPRDEIAIDDIKVTFNPSVATPILYTYDGTAWSPSDPNGMGTSIDNIIVNSGNPTIDTPTTMNDINVEPGAAITIDATVNISEINLESTSTNYASLIVTASGTVNGTVNYARYVNRVGTGASGGNDLVSSPVISTDASFSNFLTFGLPNNASKLATNGVVYAFGPYDNDSSSPAYVNFATDATTNLEAGVGYRAATISGETVRFTGNVNTSNVFTPVASPENGSEWNLIGNPYPSYVSASDFLNPSNIGVMDSGAVGIYAYNDGQYAGSAPTTGNFTIINLATLSLPGENFNIAPGQGFFIASNAVGGPIGFTTSMQTTVGSDDYISNRNVETSNYLLKLNVSNDKSYTTSLFFDENSSLGLDPGYDAAKLNIETSNLELHSHLVQGNTGRDMALQALNISDLSNVSVPLSLRANQGEQISFNIEYSNLPESINVYLDDTLENTVTLLNQSDYVFTPSSTITGTGRFFLRFSEDQLSTIENSLNYLNVYALSNSKELAVDGQLKESTTLELFDIQGRRVLKNQLDNTRSDNRVDVSSIDVGVYIVTITNNSEQLSEKVILN